MISFFVMASLKIGDGFFQLVGWLVIVDDEVMVLVSQFGFSSWFQQFVQQLVQQFAFSSLVSAICSAVWFISLVRQFSAVGSAVFCS